MAVPKASHHSSSEYVIQNCALIEIYIEKQVLLHVYYVHVVMCITLMCVCVCVYSSQWGDVLQDLMDFNSKMHKNYLHLFLMDCMKTSIGILLYNYTYTTVWYECTCMWLRL